MISKNDKLRIILQGYIVRGPVAGLTWDCLHYILGLKALGHEVYFFEDSDDYISCYNPTTHSMSKNPKYGIQYLQKIFKDFGLNDVWTYYDYHTGNWYGPIANERYKIIDNADLLINLSGVNPLRNWFMNIPKRVYIDTDPLYTQVKNILDHKQFQFVEKHSHFFTIGENINKNICQVPNDQIKWNVTRHAIYLENWPSIKPNPNGILTTVMNWSSYKPVSYSGIEYEMKSKSFYEYIDLPHITKKEFEIAIGGPNIPEELLKNKGWILRNALEISKDLWKYQKYITNSAGEFSIAKHGYVISNSGWFSERSAVYLSSGLPVIVQDTGFSEWLDTKIGVIPFSDIDSAVAGIDDFYSRYEIHCNAARDIAYEYFDSKKILNDLIGVVMQ